MFASHLQLPQEASYPPRRDYCRLLRREEGPEILDKIGIVRKNACHLAVGFFAGYDLHGVHADDLGEVCVLVGREEGLWLISLLHVHVWDLSW